MAILFSPFKQRSESDFCQDGRIIFIFLIIRWRAKLFYSAEMALTRERQKSF